MIARHGRLAALLATAGVVSVCDGSNRPPVEPPSPSVLRATVVLPPAATVATPLSVTVRVTDARELPVGAQEVAWSVAGGAGSVSPSTSMTGADGVARATWRLAGRVGANALEVRSGALSTLRFQVEGTAGRLAHILSTPDPVRLIEGDYSVQLAVAGSDAWGNEVPVRPSFRALDPGIAAVSSSGLVTPAGPGTGRVLLESAADAVADTVQVFVHYAPVGMRITPSGPTLNYNGETLQLTAEALDSAGQPMAGAKITWSARQFFMGAHPGGDYWGPAQSASVSSTGLVRQIYAGCCVWISAASGPASYSVPLTLRVVTATLAVQPASVALMVGDSVPLTVTARDSAGVQLGFGVFSYEVVLSGSAVKSIYRYKSFPTFYVTAVLPGTASLSIYDHGYPDVGVVVPITVSARTP